jgi:hypothetical protein
VRNSTPKAPGDGAVPVDHSGADQMRTAAQTRCAARPDLPLAFSGLATQFAMAPTITLTLDGLAPNLDRRRLLAHLGRGLSRRHVRNWPKQTPGGDPDRPLARCIGAKHSFFPS